MKAYPLPLIATALLFSLPALSQQDSAYRLFLRNGSFIPQKNIDSSTAQQINRKAFRVNGQSFAIIQFEHIPTADERQRLLKSGITLINYIPNNAYTASINGAVNSYALEQVKARAIIELTPEQKMPSLLAKGIVPSWSIKIPGTLDVWISFLKIVSAQSVINELRQRNFDVTSTVLENYHVIALRIPLQRLNELASLPFVEYVQPAPHEDQPLNNVDRSNGRANVLNAPTSFGGRNLKGEGVVIGIGDNADPQFHVDFTNRLIGRTYASPSAEHGKHVAGIAAGAGIMNELYKGYAPKATIITQYFAGIWLNAASYVQDYGMVLTNNSYGAIAGDCSYNGLYDLYSAVLDQQAFDFPYLQHVFASGNSGLDNCPPYPTGFKTVLGSYQVAKNVLTVGATDSAGVNASFSSRGPTVDGRVKPEISTMGQRVMSAGFGSYWYNSGTSMAAPGATGGLTLLYQLYRQRNGGSNPKSGLIKAIACNSSRDIGNAGPDFSNGFGWLDLQRAALTIENNRYFISNIGNGSGNNHTITVPANTAQLKVMLYWHDPPASLLSSQTLVNDLDLTVQTPSSTTVFPKILDTIPSNITSTSTEGPDHINNIEQVIINNPQPGTYTANIKGNAVTQNSPQEYFVAYDLLPDSTQLTFPIGSESFSTTDSALIQWDSHGSAAAFTLKYSTDDGATWVTIDNAIAGNLRQKKWIVPNISTDRARIQLVNNVTGAVSTSSVFTILGWPTVTLASTQCEGYININWQSIPAATDYEIFMLRGDDMQSVAIVTDTTYSFNGLSKDSVYWVAVRARLNGGAGRRSLAISRQPNSGSCAGSISDNDLKLDSIVAPISGRKFTNSELGNSVHIKVRVKNLDDVAIGNFDVKYSVNGGPWISENVSTPVNAGSSYTHAFSTTYDFSSIGTYTIRAIVDNPSDSARANDTLTTVVKQLANQPIDLTSSFNENFDGAPPQEIKSAQIGLTNLDRFDFSTTSLYGRLRSFVNSGIAHSGNRAITLDVDRYIYPSSCTNYLLGTFNLSNYNANSDDIRLDFFYNNHSQVSNAANKVWIRGNETLPWVSVYDLFANQNDPGLYKKTSSIELSDLLVSAGQNLGASCQIRWGQFGYLPAADQQNAAGYTFDDVHLYKVIDDIQMISIDTPIVSSCGLNSTTPVKVTVRNSVNTTISAIPVKMRIDGGAVISETIASIGGNATIPYVFSSTANLSAFGSHTIQVWVDYPTDSYRQNDTATVTIVNSPVISSFPYLENFETGNGSWYSEGVRNSWQYGTPMSNKINSAASGSKAWKTRLTGNYNDLELSYLYSPCFDISGITNPTLSFSVALDLEDCGSTLCDGAWIEYSVDGLTWSKLGSNGIGTNWYNKNYSGNQLWSVENYTRWHVATTPLPTGISRLRLRFVMNSDPGVNREGIAVDDIHIYDNTMGIYAGGPMSSPIGQNISGGSSWIDFTSGGKLVASIQPNGQNLGSTDVQAYINAGAVRVDSNQYYHDRNITIKPANNNLSDSAIVRFYFLDSETEQLINATGCGTCSKPSSAYELGVAKYNDGIDSLENGTISDDSEGAWAFIRYYNAVKVPFDKGYYAEYDVRSFSEFWLKKEAFNRPEAPPLQLGLFKATRQLNNDVLVDWMTLTEGNVSRFEIEVARGNGNYQLNNFIKIGEVPGRQNVPQPQSYNYTDAEPDKSGVRYYRLKFIYRDGSFSYSVIKPVVFSGEFEIQVYPNPSSGIFNFLYQQNEGEILNLRIYNMAGQLVKQQQTIATGFVQKVIVDLQNPGFAGGVYLLSVDGNAREVFKLVKK
ncbi:MAG: T9SS type A sorting domain-containing protein [Bacteroidetes bacterium]|nr:MAG: T9SS type A sorting domain-containing protein [Bacteroidota bacterium]